MHIMWVLLLYSLPIYALITVCVYWLYVLPRSKAVKIEAKIVDIKYKLPIGRLLLGWPLFLDWSFVTAAYYCYALVEYKTASEVIRKEEFPFCVFKQLAFQPRYFQSPESQREEVEKNIGTTVNLWIVPDDSEIILSKRFNLMHWVLRYVIFSVPVFVALVAFGVMVAKLSALGG